MALSRGEIQLLTIYHLRTKCDMLVIDECSTVSNSDMRKVLEKAEFKVLVLIGDVYQIESIYFGNWFEIARNFISSESVFELIFSYLMKGLKRKKKILQQK